MVNTTFLNIAGVSVTKYGSAAQRTTVDMAKKLFVWIIFMNLPIGTNE